MLTLEQLQKLRKLCTYQTCVFCKGDLTHIWVDKKWLNDQTVVLTGYFRCFEHLPNFQKDLLEKDCCLLNTLEVFTFKNL